MATTTEVQDRFVEGRVTDQGFRPQLFTVPGGTYAGSGSFGSNVAAEEPAATNIEAVTDRSGVSPCTTRGDIRVHGHDVDFEVQLSLDLTQTAPVVNASDELRIRSLPLSTSENSNYLNTLPPSDKKFFRQPLFEHVEILAVDTTGASAPVHVASLPGADQTLQARFLYGGELALVRIDTSAGTATDVPALWSDISGLFGATSQPQCLQITIRASYRGDRPRGSAF